MTATFTAVYTLSVTAGFGGTITSSDGYINCSASCSQNYLTGTTVVLTATPAQSWMLAGWSGCDTTQNNTCTVTMNSARSVTAMFTATLLVSLTGSGAITSADGFINCGATCSHNYSGLNGVILTAIPAQGWVLTKWTSCDAVHGNVCNVSTYKARSVAASFSLTSVLSASSSSGGTVISGDGYINCGSACSHNYPTGTTLALAATPAVGSTLNHWTGCASTQANYCIVTINGPTSVSATFAPIQVSFGSLVFNPTTARRVGIALGTLTFASPTPSGGVTLRLTSNHPNIVAPPSTLYVRGGLTSIRFGANVLTVRPTAVTITATDGNTSTSATLNVTPSTNTSVSTRPADVEPAPASKQARQTAAPRPMTHETPSRD